MDENDDINLSDISDEELSEEELLQLQESFAALENEADEDPIFSLNAFNEYEDIDISDTFDKLLEDEESNEGAVGWQDDKNAELELETTSEIYKGRYEDTVIDTSIFNKKEKFKLTIFIKNCIKMFKDAQGKDKIILGAIGGLSVLAVVGIIGIGVLLAVMAITEPFSPGPQALLASHGFNNSNHIFINDVAHIGGESLHLNRILLDEAATVFYFEGPIEANRYSFSLVDFNGVSYAKDISFARNLTREANLSQHIVRFTALDRLATGFTLYIIDNFTGELATKEYTFDGEAIAPGIYFNTPVALYGNTAETQIYLNSALFSSSGSTLSIALKNTASSRIVFSSDIYRSPFALRHMGGHIVPINNSPTYYEFESSELTLFRMDFSPLRGLFGEVEVIFEGMYLEHSPRLQQNAQSLFVASENRQIRLDFDSHSIIIEGMQRQGSFIVMPLHGLQLTNYVQQETEEYIPVFERVATTVDVTLVGRNANGEVRIPGQVLYDARGTDVRFDIVSHEDILNFNTHELYIELDHVRFLIPQFSASINLNQGSLVADEERVMLMSAIEQAFTAHNTNQNEQYMAQVSQIFFISNNIYAVVNEEVITGNSKIRNAYRIAATLSNNVLTINTIDLQDSFEDNNI